MSEKGEEADESERERERDKIGKVNLPSSASILVVVKPILPISVIKNFLQPTTLTLKVLLLTIQSF